ncbi:MAG: porin, partial [Planctomycetaceae bacterium]|nr:porin [Planctomycetaceae bacterium]
MRKVFVFSLFYVLFFYLGAVSAQTETNSIYLGQETCSPCEKIGEEDLTTDPCSEVDWSDCDPCAACDSGDENSCNLWEKKFNPFKNKRHHQSFFDNIEVFGWIQGGVYANSRGNTIARVKGSNYNDRKVTQFVETSGNGNLLSTVHSTDFQINQVWLGVKKEADGKHGFDWGFAVEGFFGTEAWFAQSWGDAKFDYGWQDGDYRTAIPQLYAQLAYGDFSVKLGKFETILGYEPLRAPDFFFFSHSYIFMMEPYSHSGVFAEYAPNDKLSLGAGYVTGTDSSPENAYDDHGFLGTISYQFTDKLNFSYAVMYNHNGNGAYRDLGDVDRNRYGLSGTNAYLHTVAANYDISDKLHYGFQWNYNDIKTRNGGDHVFMYGIANYLTYQLTDRLGIGFRAEWANLNNIFGYGNDL